jgi:diguanylate cyclase (GGDEF)-like protein
VDLPMTMGALARPALVILGSARSDGLDAMFRADERLPCVVVEDGTRLGLVMRERFGQVMSGPFGFGRALLARSTVAELTDWAPLRAPASATVVSVAQRLRSRPVEHRYDDVLVDLDGAGVGCVSAARLLDALARQLSHRAIHDELTGLISRAHFLDLLAAACTDITGQRVMLAVVDIDGMKRINDSHGHLVGDAALDAVARHLRQMARPGEIVARLGADEFVVMARVGRQVSGDAAAQEIGRRCRLAVSVNDGFTYPDVRLVASVGVAVSGNQADPVTLLSEADMAMFTAKQAGGNQVAVTTQVETSLTLDVAEVDRSVAQAIEHDELRLFYQPIVAIADGTIASVEALVRWEHPRLGFLTPDQFLPGARRAGHLPAMDRWVLARACSDLIRLSQDLGPRAPETVCVNLAPATLATGFDDLVESTLTVAGLPARRLWLELPEGADLETLTTAAPKLERLRRLGVGLTLDDMGAGSTSLRHLSTLTIGGLKIDAAFVTGMLHNPRDYTVVKLLADLGAGLGLPTTAEGVEDADQLAAIAELGIGFAQGYHLGRPQPLDQITELFESSAHVLPA